MINASKAIEEANSYPEIRLFTASDVESSTPLYELKEVEQPWSVASASKTPYLLWRISFAKGYISIVYRNRTNTNEALLGGFLCPPSEFQTFSLRNFGRFTCHCWDFA